MIDVLGQNIRVDDFVALGYSKNRKMYGTIDVRKVIAMSDKLMLLDNGYYAKSSDVIVVYNVPDSVKNILNRIAESQKIRYQTVIRNLNASVNNYRRGSWHRYGNNFLIIYQTRLRNFATIIRSENRSISDIVNIAHLKMFELANILPEDETITRYSAARVQKGRILFSRYSDSISANNSFSNLMLTKKQLLPLIDNFVLLTNETMTNYGIVIR